MAEAVQANPFIPRRLDDQWKVGIWDIDVAAPFAICLLLGLFTNTGTKGILAGATLGIVVSRWFSKKKADKHPAFAWHWVYWHLPDALSRMKATPPSYIRRMVG